MSKDLGIGVKGYILIAIVCMVSLCVAGSIVGIVALIIRSLLMSI